MSDLTCPHCNASVPIGARFCGECGKPIQAQPPAPTAAAPGTATSAAPATSQQPWKKYAVWAAIAIVLLAGARGLAAFLGGDDEGLGPDTVAGRWVCYSDTGEVCHNNTPLDLGADGTWEWGGRGFGNYAIEGRTITFTGSTGPPDWSEASFPGEEDDPDTLLIGATVWYIMALEGEQTMADGVYRCLEVVELDGSRHACDPMGVLELENGSWAWSSDDGSYAISRHEGSGGERYIHFDGQFGGPIGWGLAQRAADGRLWFADPDRPGTLWQRATVQAASTVAGTYRCATVVEGGSTSDCSDTYDVLVLGADGAWNMGPYRGTFSVLDDLVYFGGSSIGPPNWGPATAGPTTLVFDDGSRQFRWNREA